MHPIQQMIEIKVNFFSYFKDLTGCEATRIDLEEGATLEQAMEMVREKFPKLESMKRSTLVAVGLEYVATDHVLSEGEEISLFPPVQGG